MPSRRDFLKIMLATASAPAIVRVASLMPIYAPSQTIEVVHDGWLWDDDQGLIMSLGQLKPNEWIQRGLIWTREWELQQMRKRLAST